MSDTYLNVSTRHPLKGSQYTQSDAYSFGTPPAPPGKTFIVTEVAGDPITAEDGRKLIIE